MMNFLKDSEKKISKNVNFNKKFRAGKFCLFLLFGGLSFLLALTMISADLGCCFDINTGFCSPGTELENCKAANTQFFSSSNCAAAAECVLGCCELGTDFPFITARECELRSEQKGFEFNWIEEDSDSCRLRALASEEGACILGTYRDKCKILTREKCATGDFTSDANCVDLKIYNQTENTMCYRESVYFKDTAGNPAALKEECKYDEGKICKQKSAKESYCADLNCVDAKGVKRKNGETWCYFDLGGEYFDIEEIYTDGELNGAPVGSRFFSRYCSNGEIVTEPCADYRMEFCNKGRCEINKWEDCFLANTVSKETGQAKIDEEACDSYYCYTKIPMDCVASGGQNFCGSERDSYRGSSTGGSDAKEYASKPLEDLDLPMCVPKVPSGFDFYSSASSQASSAEESSSICSYANYLPADLKFTYGGTHIKRILWLDPKVRHWVYTPPAGKKYGYIAFSGPLMDNWNYAYTTDPGTGGVKLGNYVLSGYNEIMAYAVLDRSMGVSSKTLSLLGERCSVVSDCAGKSNWAGAAGGNAAVTGDVINSLKNLITGNILSITGKASCTSDYDNGISATPHYWTCDYDNQIFYISDSPDAQSKCTAYCGKFSAPTIITTKIEDSRAANYEEEMPMKDPNVYTWSYDGYLCGTFIAPAGDSDCGKCGSNNLPCTEYRCKSLGKRCEYKEPSGADKGFCISSSDKTPPIIKFKSINPASPIEPYTPVEISVSTNEAAECKFSLNSVPARYSSMKLNFGDGYSFEHNVKLNIPGQIAGLRGNITEYPLLTTDGKYTVYVRCMDAAGNGEVMKPLLINFEVMKTPDAKIFPPRNFNPVSGSPIKYETTSRYVTFEMLEPAECKWDFSDKTYEAMTKNFDCDTGISANPTKNYKCSGVLTNITANKTIKYERQVVCRETSSGEVCREESVAVTGVNSEGKKFYIRCKDQPELENDSVIIKGITYSRNIMQTSFVYELRNSDPLKITEVSPSGKVYVGSKDTLELAAFTSSGANNGVARCLWKISNKSDFSGTSYTSFKTTNSTIHKNLLNANLLFGYNYVSIRCADSADNTAYLNSTFNLILDKTSPKAISLSKSLDNLKIKTNEAAKCYYSFDNVKRCLFAKENSTEMGTSDNYVHTAGWQNDKTFFIKCEDLKGNLAAGCTLVVDTRAYVEF